MATTEAPTRRRRVPWPVEFYRSAVGKKWVMAITGILLLGFIFAHVIGNLKAFIPYDDLEAAWELDLYGEALRGLFFPLVPRYVVLWIMRIGLILATVLHVHAAYSLTLMNRRSRSVGYQGPREYLAANYASRTMRWSGVIVLLFVAWHLADFTWGVQPFAPEGFEHGDIQANFVASFSRVPVSVLYIVANLALGLHIYHGAWSMFQSIGANNPRFNPWRRYFASAFAAFVVIVNVSLPLAVLAGVVTDTV